MTSALARARQQIGRWRRDVVAFVREQFQVEPDPWQHRALEAFASDDPAMRRISLQACAGPGKTAVLAWCGWHFLVCRGDRGEHPKGAAVSITHDNLKANLWPEFAKWRNRSAFLQAAFEWTTERVFATDHPETWFIGVRSWPKRANPDEQGRTLSGLHAKFVLALVDESGEIPPSVAKAAEQALSNCTWGKILQAGNPISHTGLLYAAATTLRHLWHIIPVTGDPDEPDAWVHTPRVGPEPAKWAREQIQTYGREDPWVMAYILGKFPPTAINALLTPEEVEAAMRRHLPEPAYDWAARILGVDVARFGDDRTVIFPRQGVAAFQPVVMRGARSTAIAARVARAWDAWGADACFLDDTGGWAHGAIDNLIEAQWTPIGVQFHAPAVDPRYLNRRAEMWFAMTEWIKAGGALPPRPSLARELTTVTYTFINGKYAIEPKEHIKKLLGQSPDEGDALALTFAEPVAPRRDPLGGPGALPRGGGMADLGDADPLARRVP